MLVAQATSIYKALGDMNRSQIVLLLGKKEQSAGSIEKSLGLSQSSTSQHLRVLKEAGLVTDRKYGNFRIYSLQPDALRKALSFFDQLWDVGLERIKKNLEG